MTDPIPNKNLLFKTTATLVGLSLILQACSPSNAVSTESNGLSPTLPGESLPNPTNATIPGSIDQYYPSTITNVDQLAYEDLVQNTFREQIANTNRSFLDSIQPLLPVDIKPEDIQSTSLGTNISILDEHNINTQPSSINFTKKDGTMSSVVLFNITTKDGTKKLYAYQKNLLPENSEIIERVDPVQLAVDDKDQNDLIVVVLPTDDDKLGALLTGFQDAILPNNEIVELAVPYGIDGINPDFSLIKATAEYNDSLIGVAVIEEDKLTGSLIIDPKFLGSDEFPVPQDSNFIQVSLSEGLTPVSPISDNESSPEPVTPTPIPPTETPQPTPTIELSLQKQLEQKYGKLAPCIQDEDKIHYYTSGEIPSEVGFKYTTVYPTGNDKIIPLIWGDSAEPRDVRVIEVACADKTGNVIEPTMWLPIGGNKFGGKINDSDATERGTLLIYYTTTDNRNGASSLTDEEILERIKDKAIKVSIPVSVPLDYVPPKQPYFEVGKFAVFSNELPIEALRTYPQHKEQLNLLINHLSVTVENFLLYPLEINIIDPPTQ